MTHRWTKAQYLKYKATLERKRLAAQIADVASAHAQDKPVYDQTYMQGVPIAVTAEHKAELAINDLWFKLPLREKLRALSIVLDDKI